LSESDANRPFEIVQPGEPDDPTSDGPKPAAEPPRRATPPPPKATAEPLRPLPGRVWGWMPTFLFAGGFLSVALTWGGVGYAWDEAYYYEPSQLAARWLMGILEGSAPFDRESIDLYWRERSEHPSLPKLAEGLSLRLFESTLGPLRAMRLPAALFFGGTLALVFILGRRAWGRWEGLIAAVALAAMPRVFGHAHFASLEPPLQFVLCLVTYCFLRGLESRPWAAAAGVAFGAALATKINALLILPPLIIWGQLFARNRYVNNFFALVTLGPLAAVALWPWLWHDTVARLLDYARFFVEHQPTALYFLGRKWGYGDAVAPWYYPSTILVVTTPLTILALMLLGVTEAALAPRKRSFGLLFLLIAATAIGMASLPSAPKYDGERLFLGAYPFLALVAGGGAGRLLGLVRRGSPEPIGEKRWARAGAVIALVVALEGASAAWIYRPFFLSYFNPIVGGVAGAAARGFEVTYWGEVVNDEVLDRLNATLPPGARLKPLALHELCLLHHQRWGHLRRDIILEAPPPYDFHLLLMRRGFFARPESALADSDRFPPLAEWRLRGVTLLALYRTGPEFDQFWPTWGTLNEAGSTEPASTHDVSDRRGEPRVSSILEGGERR